MKNGIYFFLFLFFVSCLPKKQKNELRSHTYIYVPEREVSYRNIRYMANAFEMSDHAVTNSEYKLFTDATGYDPPLHWINGKIPVGKENHPVVYVNRFDTQKYLDWLNSNSERYYRLPQTIEFLSASAGCDYSYQTINYNEKGTHVFNEDNWNLYLQPSFTENPDINGFHHLFGNVWEWVDNDPDPRFVTHKFGYVPQVGIERSIMGGSWATGKICFETGEEHTISPGIRYPDIGFRVVREPITGEWNVSYRQVTAVAATDNSILISWAALATDSIINGFHIYRIEGNKRIGRGKRLNNEMLKNTSFKDTGVVSGTIYQYRIAAITKTTDDELFSEWTGIEYNENKPPVIAMFKPKVKGKGSSLHPIFGMLEGEGRLGCVVRIGNGNTEQAPDPGFPIQLEAFAHTGKSLWRKDIAFYQGTYGNTSNAPFNVFDMDGDGKDEVITFYQEGEDIFVAILDGLTGKVRHKAGWPQMQTDLYRTSTRHQIAIAYLDGITPSVIVQSGLYENEIIAAYDCRLNKLWEYKSMGATSGSGGHYIEVADVNNDGCDEIIYGSTCLNSDGTVRWSIFKQHPDVISIQNHIPSREGLEIFYLIESNMHAGMYMVDADSGQILWKQNNEDDPKWSHGHSGWTADIYEGSEGFECLADFDRNHADNHHSLYSSSGTLLAENFQNFRPVEWLGNAVRDLIPGHGKKLAYFDGQQIKYYKDIVPNPIPDSRVIMVADLTGDFRSELVVLSKDNDNNPVVCIITPGFEIARSAISARTNREYRLWLARNIGGGYGSVRDYSPQFIQF